MQGKETQLVEVCKKKPRFLKMKHQSATADNPKSRHRRGHQLPTADPNGATYERLFGERAFITTKWGFPKIGDPNVVP